MLSKDILIAELIREGLLARVRSSVERKERDGIRGRRYQLNVEVWVHEVIEKLHIGWDVRICEWKHQDDLESLDHAPELVHHDAAKAGKAGMTYNMNYRMGLAELSMLMASCTLVENSSRYLDAANEWGKLVLHEESSCWGIRLVMWYLYLMGML